MLEVEVSPTPPFLAAVSIVRSLCRTLYRASKASSPSERHAIHPLSIAATQRPTTRGLEKHSSRVLRALRDPWVCTIGAHTQP